VILVDGGREQLAAAARVLMDLGRNPDRALMAISKGDFRKSGDEQLHFFGEDEILDLGSAPLSMPLWTELRDEAHRTSNRFNGRRLRSSRLRDPFSKLPGIGAVSVKRLRSVFGSMNNFLASDDTMIEEVKGLSRRQKDILLAYHRSNQSE
jgi:excinuclease ABC subunit C